MPKLFGPPASNSSYNESVEAFLARRSVDKLGDTIDFLLIPKRDTKAALRSLGQALRNNEPPLEANIGKSGAKTAAIENYHKECGSVIQIRQFKYLIEFPRLGDKV